MAKEREKWVMGERKLPSGWGKKRIKVEVSFHVILLCVLCVRSSHNLTWVFLLGVNFRMFTYHGFRSITMCSVVFLKPFCKCPVSLANVFYITRISYTIRTFTTRIKGHNTAHHQYPESMAGKHFKPNSTHSA